MRVKGLLIKAACIIVTKNFCDDHFGSSLNNYGTICVACLFYMLQQYNGYFASQANLYLHPGVWVDQRNQRVDTLVIPSVQGG